MAARPALLTTDEIAAELRLTPDEVRTLIRQQAWTAKKVGRRWLTHPAEIDKYLAAAPSNR
jgi:excisionase family DNA binding protein